MIDTAKKTGIQGRIINVSSVIHSWVKRSGFCFNDMLCGKKYNYHLLHFSAKLRTSLIALNFDTNNVNSLLNNKCSYNGTRAYAQSKLASILHVKEVDRQLKVRNNDK